MEFFTKTSVDFVPQHYRNQWCSNVWLVVHICLSETLRGPQELIILFMKENFAVS